MICSYPLEALGNVADISAGGGAPQNADDFSTAGHPFVRAGSLKPLLEGKSESHLEHLAEGIARSHRLQLFPADSVLFAKSGMSATKGHIYKLKAPAFVVNHLAVITCSTKLDAGYLYHCLRVFSPMRLIQDEAYPSIRLSDISSMKIPLPPLSEQTRIAAILDQADALRVKRREGLAQLDSLSQAIFIEMFGDPMTNPKNFARKRIGDIGKAVTGNTPPRANPENYGKSIEWIKSDNINTPHYYLTQAEEGLSIAGKLIARTVPAGAILVTCIAGSPECIGNAAMADREVAFNQQINAFIPEDGDAHFYYAQILVGKKLIQEASTASMKGMVSKGRFEQILLISPPVDLQRKFARKSAAVENLKSMHLASLSKLDSMFASLQHRAFSGEL